MTTLWPVTGLVCQCRHERRKKKVGEKNTVYVIRYNFKYSLRIGGRGERGGELEERERGGEVCTHVPFRCLFNSSQGPLQCKHSLHINHVPHC